MPNDPKFFNLFVYGTLMSGFRAHEILSGLRLTTAKISGNLYHYIAGYPMVDIVKHCDSVEGSFDYDLDCTVQEAHNHVKIDRLPFNIKYGHVIGEFYRIPYDEQILSSLDCYEGFDPDGGYYKRTLVPVQIGMGITWAWVYNIPKDRLPSNTVRIYTGNWRDCTLLSDVEPV